LSGNEIFSLRQDFPALKFVKKVDTLRVDEKIYECEKWKMSRKEVG